jgi:hypothetical protein
MTIYPDKTAAAIPASNQQAHRAWPNILLVVFLAATILPLPGGAGGIHCIAGILLLITCGIHLMWHGQWIKAVILNKPKKITPTLRRQRRLFWATLLSGLLCGLSGLVSLFLGHNFLPLVCLVNPIHTLSGLVFLGLNIYHLALHRNWFTTRIGRVFHNAQK